MTSPGGAFATDTSITGPPADPEPSSERSCCVCAPPTAWVVPIVIDHRRMPAGTVVTPNDAGSGATAATPT